MDFKFNNERPIYKQLTEQLQLMIVTGLYKPGDKLPSVRELSILIQINPNTIQRALNELEDLELITTKRTLGKFVTEDLVVIDKCHKLLINDVLSDYLQELDKLEVTNAYAIEFIKKNRRELKK